MSSSDYRVTTLLTEHLGFAPLTLIDEVINAVNHIMYNCTKAMDDFLNKGNIQREELKRKALEKSHSIGDADIHLDDNDHGDRKLFPAFPVDEINLGLAELETLLVSHVDKNFDKFELYTLRNILTIPSDLVEGGWIRLKHHESLDLLSLELPQDTSELDKKIRELVHNINLELQLRKILHIQKTKARKLVQLLRHYKECVSTILLTGTNSRLSPEVKSALKQHLEPMNENVYFLIGQVDDLLAQVIQLNDKVMKDLSLEGIKDMKFTPSNRDMYIKDKSLKILDEIGVLGSESASNPSAVLYSAYAHETIE